MKLGGPTSCRREPDERLVQTLYGWDEEAESNTLEVHIHNLRKKLSSDLIRTVRGIGYLVDGRP